MATKVDINFKIPALEQLLNLTASGIGSVAGPMLAGWQARQLGKAKQIAAEADAAVLRIQAEAQSEARAALVPSGAQASGELDIGAVVEQRIRFQERKRQANIMSVVAKAADQHQGREVPHSEPDHDWTARFFSEVQDVSSEEMQALWARVLAGEVERQGSTSIRTLQVMKNLDQAAARLFTKLCSSCLYLPSRQLPSVGGAIVPSLGGNAASNALSKYGLGFADLNRLNECNLIISDYNSWQEYTISVMGSSTTLPFEFQDASWVLTRAGDQSRRWDGKISGVALSLSGRELAAVVDLNPAEEFGAALRAFFQRQGLSMTGAPPVRTVEDA